MAIIHLIHDKTFFINKVKNFIEEETKFSNNMVISCLLALQTSYPIPHRTVQEQIVLKSVESAASQYSLQTVQQYFLPLISTDKYITPFLTLSPASIWWEDINSPRKPSSLHEFPYLEFFPDNLYEPSLLMVSEKRDTMHDNVVKLRQVDNDS